MAGLSADYPIYASEADLEALLSREVEDAAGLIVRASGAVRRHTVLAIYDVGEDGFTPTNTRIANAFHDATILQAAGYVAARISSIDLVASSEPRIQSKSLGTRSVTYAADTDAATARAALLNGALTPDSYGTLRGAGLISSGVDLGGGGRDYDLLRRKWVS